MPHDIDIDIALAGFHASQCSSTFDLNLNMLNLVYSIDHTSHRLTSVLNGSSFTATQVRAGLGCGIISRTVLGELVGM